MPWKKRSESLITPRQALLAVCLALAAGAFACIAVSKTSDICELTGAKASFFRSVSLQALQKAAQAQK